MTVYLSIYVSVAQCGEKGELMFIFFVVIIIVFTITALKNYIVLFTVRDSFPVSDSCLEGILHL